MGNQPFQAWHKKNLLDPTLAGLGRSPQAVAFMLTFISVPTDLSANIGTQVTDLVGGLAPYIVLVLGVFMGLFILSWVIDKIRDTKDETKSVMQVQDGLENYQEDF